MSWRSRAKFAICGFMLMIIVGWTKTSLAQMVEDGLFALWTFDQIDGLTVRDEKGNHDGTIGGNPKIVNGRVGLALAFDGDDYVDIGPVDINDWREISVAAWFKTSKIGKISARIAAKDQQGIAGNWILWYSALAERAESWSFVAYDKQVDKWQRAEYQKPLSDDNWHYVVGSVSQKANKVYFYVDGELEASAPFTAPSLDDSDSEIITIGADSDTKGPKAHLFDGFIDQVAIYNRALRIEEVRQNFAAIEHAVRRQDKLTTTWRIIKELGN